MIKSLNGDIEDIQHNISKTEDRINATYKRASMKNDRALKRAIRNLH